MTLGDVIIIASLATGATCSASLAWSHWLGHALYAAKRDRHSPPVFCRDCIFIERQWIGDTESPSRCTRPEASKAHDLVTGETAVRIRFCKVEREAKYGPEYCGPQGRYFVRKCDHSIPRSDERSAA